jgi:hypothetical protein
VKKITLYIALIVLLPLFYACKALFGISVSYSTTGASIPAEMTTFTVKNFRNRGAGCSPNIAYVLRDGLQDKIQSQTSLKMVTNKGDAMFEGEITNCTVQPLAVQGNNTAAKTRFTISISVSYTNELDEEQNFKQTFTRYEDYSSSQNFSDVEDDLIDIIVEQLTEDIFNKAFVNW